MNKEKFNSIYKPHFNMCDDILTSLLDDKKPDVVLTKKDFLAEDDNQVYASLETLQKAGYIIRLDNDRKVKVTGEGIAFRKSGGYEGKLKTEDARKMRDEIYVIVGATGAGLAGLWALVDLIRWLL